MCATIDIDLWPISTLLVADIDLIPSSVALSANSVLRSKDASEHSTGKTNRGNPVFVVDLLIIFGKL